MKNKHSWLVANNVEVFVWKNEFSGLRQGRWSRVSWSLCLDTGVVFEVSGSLSNLISKFLLLQVLLNLGKPWSDFDSASQTAKGFLPHKKETFFPFWQRHFSQSARHYFCMSFLSIFSVHYGILTTMWRSHNHWELALNWFRLHQALQRGGIQMCVRWNEMMAWNSFWRPSNVPRSPPRNPDLMDRILIFFRRRLDFKNIWLGWGTPDGQTMSCCVLFQLIVCPAGWWHGQVETNNSQILFYLRKIGSFS